MTNVQKAVAQKSSIAALEGVLLESLEGMLSLCAYNTELAITTSIPATIYSSGSIVLNAHLFTEIVRKLPEDAVELELFDDFSVKIKSGRSRFNLMGINPEEFPSLPEVSEASSFVLSSETLKTMIRQTIFAVADVDTKPVHMGTLFDIKNKTITLVSVDGYRLALRTEPIKEDLELSFVVPGKTLREVLRLLPSEEQDLKISAGMRHIMFNVGECVVISRLLDGEFLDYGSTIPKDSANIVTVKTQEMIDSIERVSLLITDRLKSPVKCMMTKNKINISCVTIMGKADDEISSSSNIDSEVEIAFNNKYMLDALKNTDCDEIELHLNGALSPIKILPKEGNSFLFLVLPVRVKNG